MRRRTALFALALAVVLLVACGRTAEPEDTFTPSPNPAPAPAPPPADPAPTPEPTAEPHPEPAATTPEGTILTPRDGVELLLPEGWEEEPATDDALVRLVRAEPVANTLVRVSLESAVDENLPADAGLDALAAEFTEQLPEQLADQKWSTQATATITVAGRPALSIVGDLVDAGTRYRSRLVLVREGTTTWTLSILGPRDAFDTELAPTFDAIVASLKLP